MDDDILGMREQELVEEIIRLRNGIRNHRDQRGDDRCWLDDSELYKLLPDGIGAITELPTREVFLKNCEHFHKTRQGSCEHLHDWGGVVNPCDPKKP